MFRWGFRPCKECLPSEIEIQRRAKLLHSSLADAPAYCYSVICNEDEVLRALLTLDVSFSGSCHYGDRNVFYLRGGKIILYVENLGLASETYHFGVKPGLVPSWVDLKVPPVRRVSKKKYLRETGNGKSTLTPRINETNIVEEKTGLK